LQIFSQTKALVQKEKYYTLKILANLKFIEKDKLYADLKYPSLFKYIVKELGYTDAEASIRVNAVRLMLKSKKAAKKITDGEISLTNACLANKAIKNIKDKSLVEKIIVNASNTSTRKFKDYIQTNIKKERKEILLLDEHTLKQMDRLKEKYGDDLTSYELIKILLEKELKAPAEMRRVRKISKPEAKTIPRFVKRKVYTGECANCKAKYNLEYDHKVKRSHGGVNLASNIQILCRNCNQRKEIMGRQTNLFT
jgi:5-methylcytosine-specific restriction endonuclease McrA